MKVLELFAGTRSIGKAFESHGHEVFSVEWDKKFENINLYADIGQLTAQEVLEKFGHPDVVWASPDCFPAGTLIWTKSGYKNVEDIRCFDEVLTHKNRYRRVYATMRTNKYDMYKVKISGCEEVLVSSEHPYLVRKKIRHNTRVKGKAVAWTNYQDAEWLKVKDLTSEYRVGIPINCNSVIPNYLGCVYENHNTYGMSNSHIENTLGSLMSNSDFWWVVGNYFGNGSLSVAKYTIDIACNANKSDADILSNKLSSLCIKHSIYMKATAKHVCICSKEWCEFLSQFGIGAVNKQITPMILDLPIHLLKSFLDGYICADGHYETISSNRVCHISTISKHLAYSLQLAILKAYGRYCSLCITDHPNDVICGRKVNVHKAYKLSFYENYNEKRSQYFIEDNICWVNVRKVEKLSAQQTTVYNFSVEEDESYTANNIIVHNCSSYSVAGIGHNRIKNSITGNLDPKTDYAKFCDNVNQHVIELIKELNPTYWFIENPRGGLRKMSWMQGLPRYTISYCQYGDTRQKPTDLWTNHPNPRFKPCCKPGDPCHEPAPRGSRTGTQGLQNAMERSRIPDKLCEHIVDICEHPDADVQIPGIPFRLF